MQLIQVYKASTHRSLELFEKIEIKFNILKYKVLSYFSYQ